MYLQIRKIRLNHKPDKHNLGGRHAINTITQHYLTPRIPSMPVLCASRGVNFIVENTWSITCLYVTAKHTTCVPGSTTPKHTVHHLSRIWSAQLVESTRHGATALIRRLNGYWQCTQQTSHVALPCVTHEVHARCYCEKSSADDFPLLSHTLC
jgi:hypothetical protein